MAKSSLSGSHLRRPEDSAVTTFPTWSYELLIDNFVTSVDLQGLAHYLCDPTKKKQDRQRQVTRYAYAFQQELDRQTAHATLYNSFLKFKQYLVWCDQNSLYPFSETTWRQYHRHLWELVLLGNSSAPIWQMSEGQDTGLKERSAGYIFSATEQALTWCGENVFQWGKQLRRFRSGKPKSYEAYSERELPIILNRLSSYFFQLAIPLLSESPPRVISVEIKQAFFDVPVNAQNKKGRAKHAMMNVDTAFNQAMACGYYLLSYFTAFNTSQLLDLCHPVTWIEDKSVEYYRLTAHKRRANKEVLSLVGGEVHKKSLQFIETLLALSLKYSTGTNDKLLYWLDRDGEQRALSSTLLINTQLSGRLLLMSDGAFKSIPYLMGIHAHFIETSSKGYIEFDEVKLVKRTVVKNKRVIRRFCNRRVTTLSFAILHAIIVAHPKNRSEGVNLKHIILPLKKNLEDGILRVDFYYENGTQGSFSIDIKYENFLERLAAYAVTRQRKNVSKIHYLLPLGSEKEASQWEGLAPNLGQLGDYGIHVGQFFVNLASSRFRETAAKLARRKANKTELHVSQILNNQYRTVLKHYSEGNRYDNQLVISQGLAVIEKMSAGASLEQSKAELASELGVSVIKFDELLGTKANLNGVGVACFQHKEQSEKSQLAGSQVCFDYESCIKCQHAKLVNDVEPLYRLLSFLECMEESWFYYPERFSKNLGETIELYKKVISSTVSPDIVQQAQFKLDTEGRHMLWDNLELSSLGMKGV
ncbi:hypothetical protein CWB99_17630 [Pseudoalteromonas rubra]|uniref:Integrase n=1 Tax=Pseudoalteromonas rubra TaxID=43658 RepID=A0A5S3WHN2_9GAMM|nr:hypothetical protein [Pseudoalteromonas rubra]TMP26682.1 hypothetical protein CWB99_17630 [Pseudoalteromonas rubra]TMP30658.1 hypothetical protein CWC00_15860 [Pseudoalteromonas rubra]